MRRMEPSGLERRAYDVVVVGGGIAGLAFALRLPPMLRVALLTKGTLGESNTRYAQGGLAAALGADDSPALHERDTLAAGAGLCDPAAVHALVTGAPAAVEWLLRLGTGFDRDPKTGELLLGREAAHSRWRVLHAGGDATGAEIERALVAHLRGDPKVDLYEHAFARDLILADGRCAGLIAEPGPRLSPVAFMAPVVVLASGGAGRLWTTTSNPVGATADGLAMAMRAGVTVADVEFMQFHPTVLALPGSTPFLISEAVRGEGAYLLDARGQRFMLSVHPQAELAPRDVVARGIQRQMEIDQRDHIDLDLRHLDPAHIRQRFPTIAAELRRRGLDLATDLIPIGPAAHYFMGGIAASATGETSLPGLLALGEAACTGVHGANRLASNSLLEGLVFGLAAADHIADGPLVQAVAPSDAPDVPQVISSSASNGTEASKESFVLRQRLQETMSQYVGVTRDGSGLARAARDVAALADEASRLRQDDRAVLELRNMLQAAGTIIAAALRREESRGAHTRTDFPLTDPALDGQHTLRIVEVDGTVDWRKGSLSEAWAAIRTMLTVD